MSITLNLRTFIIKFINNCSIVKSTRLDKTIKAIINNYNNLKVNYLDTSFIIEYLNKLRIIYYLKRLEFFNSNKAKELKSILKSKKFKEFKLIFYRYYL
jgi:hypothetical protein